jgi:hypothetical protein
MNNIQKITIENEQFKNDKQDLIYLLSHDFKICSVRLCATNFSWRPYSDQVSEYTNLILDSTNQQIELLKFTNLMKDEETLQVEFYKKRNWLMLFKGYESNESKVNAPATTASRSTRLPFVNCRRFIDSLVNLIGQCY